MTIEEQILEAAVSLDSFTASDLQKRLGRVLNMERSRLNWYLPRLTDAGRLVRVGRGTYLVADKRKVFKPEIDENAKSLFVQFHESFRR